MIPQEKLTAIPSGPLACIRGPSLDYPSDMTLAALFEDQAARTPEVTAVICGTDRLSYRELNTRANCLAHILRQRGVVSDCPVGLMAARSLDQIVALLAILKAGGACVPIDPVYPLDRRRFMVEDSRIALLLSDQVDTARACAGNVEIIDLAEVRSWPGDGGNPVRVGHGYDLLYIIYTSGSTGWPKGIMLEHRNLINLLWHQYHHTTIDFSCVLQFNTLSFDVAFQEIFSTFLAGGTLVMITQEAHDSWPELGAVIEAHAVKTLFLPAAFIKYVLNDREALDLLPWSVQHIVSAGEQLILSEDLRAVLKARSISIHNHYGPAETHVATCHTVGLQEEIPTVVPIGRPIANTRVYLVGDGNVGQKGGDAGELCIAGVQVGRGYWGRPEQTAARFVPDTVQGQGRMYRTGDLARLRPDGVLEFLGRLDQQVKIHGYRVEPGEVEIALADYTGVQECVVADREDHAGGKVLVAYYTAGDDIPVQALQAFLRERLPAYMLPAYFMRLDDLPLTPNGKIDRQALPDPFPVTADVYVPPEDAIEERLADIWGKMLEIDPARLSVISYFDDLGGHSALAIIMLSRVYREFKVNIELREFFIKPTIRRVAAIVRSSAEFKTAVPGAPNLRKRARSLWAAIRKLRPA